MECNYVNVSQLVGHLELTIVDVWSCRSSCIHRFRLYVIVHEQRESDSLAVNHRSPIESFENLSHDEVVFRADVAVIQKFTCCRYGMPKLENQGFTIKNYRDQPKLRSILPKGIGERHTPQALQVAAGTPRPFLAIGSYTTNVF